MFNYTLTLLAVALIVVWQTGCSTFSSKPEGEVVSPNTFKEIKKKEDSDGKRIALIGTFSVSNSNLTVNLGQPTSLGFSDEKGEQLNK